MNFNKLIIIILAAFFITGISSPASAAETPDTIRIGVYLPMTGPMASQGKTEYDGIRIANSIKPEVLGRRIELFLIDSAAGNTGTAGVALRLIEENDVCALIGELTGPDPRGGLSAAEKRQIPTLIPASAELAAIRDRKYAFRVCLSNSLQGEAAARYAYSSLKTRKTAVLMTIDRDSSIELADIYMKHFTRLGGTIIAVAYCRTTDSDFITQLSSIMAAKPDVLYLPNSHSSVALICRQSVDMGVNTHILTSSTVHLPEFISQGGEYVEGITFTTDFDRENVSADVAGPYIEAYENETGNKAGRLDVLGADAYFLLIDAIERAQSTKGSDIRKALGDTMGFKGLIGLMDMDRDGNAAKGAVMLHVKDGSFQYIETLEDIGEHVEGQDSKD